MARPVNTLATQDKKWTTIFSQPNKVVVQSFLISSDNPSNVIPLVSTPDRYTVAAASAKHAVPSRSTRPAPQRQDQPDQGRAQQGADAADRRGAAETASVGMGTIQICRIGVRPEPNRSVPPPLCNCRIALDIVKIFNKSDDAPFAPLPRRPHDRSVSIVAAEGVEVGNRQEAGGGDVAQSRSYKGALRHEPKTATQGSTTKELQ
ncbi:hypothetical protein SAMN02745746_03069 [Pseudogulbenkiania subflava DSM 22618]|uniref:Uncharacterized protein n=1 Tax=Pseudogulbenkiania subflava DSM 22618 TaxID=1123014 RepID=A0A1Y6C1Z7_9NEIS|nr:hypothetical protein SAMN02745746_03069 [Pseudogulbenkiania subflava DSM 22618]